MRKLVMALAVIAALVLIPGVASAAKPDKVLVCHAAGQAGTTKFVTLEVPPNEGGFPQGHFTEGGTPAAGHEDDYLGACVEEPTPTPTLPNEATPTAPQPTPTEVIPTPTDVQPTPTLPDTCDVPEGCLPSTDMEDPSGGSKAVPLGLLLTLLAGASAFLLKLRPSGR